MMKRNPLPKNADELLALGEAVAAVLAENQKQWDIPTEVEAVLRGAYCSSGVCNRRRSVVAGSHKSPVAMSHLAEAKSRADRSIRQWSRRVLRSVAQQANAFRRNAGPLYEAPSRSPECELPTSSEYQRLDPVSVGVKPRSRKVTRPRRVIPNRTCEESGGGPPPPYYG